MCVCFFVGCMYKLLLIFNPVVFFSSSLPDNPNVDWNINTVSQQIQKFAIQVDANVVRMLFLLFSQTDYNSLEHELCPLYQ